MCLSQRLEFVLLWVALASEQRREIAALVAGVHAASARRRWWVVVGDPVYA